MSKISRSIIVKYNVQLHKNPLLVKSLTGAVLSSLSEMISQCTAGSIATSSRSNDGSTSKEDVPRKLRRVLSSLKLSRILIMFCYGGLLNAPINHFMYRWITNATNKRSMTSWIRRLVQLLASLSMVSPLQVLLFVSTLSLINADVDIRYSEILSSIKQGLKSKYLKVLTSSWVSASLLVSAAQNFIEPEKWSIFFSFACALVGTGQNIYLKLKQERSEKKDK